MRQFRSRVFQITLDEALEVIEQARGGSSRHVLVLCRSPA